jgi:non-homologous end joining protein Ku
VGNPNGVRGAELKLAQHILDTKEADYDPSQFVDHYEEALQPESKKAWRLWIQRQTNLNPAPHQVMPRRFLPPWSAFTR